jgi:hypothetical protein
LLDPPASELSSRVSLLSINANAAMGALGGTDSARLRRYEHVVVTGIGSNAMRVGMGGDVLQPLIRLGITDGQHRPGGHISRPPGNSGYPRVEPSLAIGQAYGRADRTRVRRFRDQNDLQKLPMNFVPV